MKKLDEPHNVTARNAWGGYNTVKHQHFQVEECDIGRNRENYLGYRHRDYVLQRSDVGRTINTMWDGTGWCCWSFTN